MGKQFYDLTMGKCDSDEYYAGVKEFTSRFYNCVSQKLSDHIDSFGKFVLQQDLKISRSFEEYFLDLLSIGVYWRVYINSALVKQSLVLSILHKLYHIRRKSSFWKRSADGLRGILATVFLFRKKTGAVSTAYNTANFKQLCRWMAAAGDFDEELQPIEVWLDYFSSLRREQVQRILEAAVAAAADLEKIANGALGEYLSLDLLASAPPGRRWREDVVLNSRPALLYYLNMFGAELLNRVYRQQFLEAETIYLLLPGCIRYRRDSRCKAENTTEGLLCRGCTDDCSVNVYTRQLAFRRIKVLLIIHGSQAFEGDHLFPEGSGVIGVACIQSLISGGLKARRLGLPAQCVLLDAPGCRHWCRKDCTTSINQNTLEAILNS